MKTLRIFDLDPLTGTLKLEVISILATLGPSVKFFVWRILKVQSRRMEFDVVGEVARIFDKHKKTEIL
jgi:hypothetical protein